MSMLPDTLVIDAISKLVLGTAVRRVWDVLHRRTGARVDEIQKNT